MSAFGLPSLSSSLTNHNALPRPVGSTGFGLGGCLGTGFLTGFFTVAPGTWSVGCLVVYRFRVLRRSVAGVGEQPDG